MNPADYDQYLPELLAATMHVAGDLERIAALPPAEVTRSEIQHHDSSDDGSRREYVAWIRHEDRWTGEDQERIANVARWLRDELPRFAASIVGTEGIDDEDDEGDPNDAYLQAAPRSVGAVLRTPFLLDAAVQTSYWRPEDVEHATYHAPLYDKTAATWLWQAWDEFVTRTKGARPLALMLEAFSARTGQANTDEPLGVEDLPEGPKLAALMALKTAMTNRYMAHGVYLEAERVVADKVRQCIDAEVPVSEIARRLGVTRARVYQIRDGRR